MIVNHSNQMKELKVIQYNDCQLFGIGNCEPRCLCIVYSVSYLALLKNSYHTLCILHILVLGACNLVTMVHFQFILFMCHKAMNERWNYRLLHSFFPLEELKRMEIECVVKLGWRWRKKGYELHTSHSRLHLLIYYLNSSMLPID